jgi:hypothetical protein
MCGVFVGCQVGKGDRVAAAGNIIGRDWDTGAGRKTGDEKSSEQQLESDFNLLFDALFHREQLPADTERQATHTAVMFLLCVCRARLRATAAAPAARACGRGGE